MRETKKKEREPETMIYKVHSMTAKGNFKLKPDYVGQDSKEADRIYETCRNKGLSACLTSHEGIRWTQVRLCGQWPKEECI